MSDKPRFSPTDTYVLDDSLIRELDTVAISGLVKQLSESYGKADTAPPSAVDDSETQTSDEQASEDPPSRQG